MEAVLTCSICQEIFKDPVLLPCQHSFCKQCVHQLVQSRGHQMTPCPQCRSEVDFRQGGVNELPGHRVLANIVEVYNRQEHHISEQPRLEWNCDAHGQPYCVVCSTCENLLCQQCVEQHHNHRIGDIKLTTEGKKKTFLPTLEDFVELKEQVQKTLEWFEDHHRDFMLRRDRYRAKIKAEYDRALDALNTWQKNCLFDFDKQHDNWHLQCETVINGLNDKIKDMKILIASSQEILSGHDIGFMKNFKEITSRLDSTSVSVKRAIKRDRQISKKLDDNVGKTDTIPNFVFPTRCDVLCHSLKFQQKQSGCVDIRENGSTLVSVKQCHGTSEFPGALTDGKFQSGKHYWEVDFTFTRKAYGEFDVYLTGVVQHKSPVSWRVGGDSHSWGVEMWWYNAGYKYSCQHKNKDLCGYITVFPHHPTHTGTVRHGFYLNCEKRTFTVLDCTHNRVLYTFRNIDMSQPLTPAVTLPNYHTSDVSARLVPTTMSPLSNAMLIVTNKL